MSIGTYCLFTKDKSCRTIMVSYDGYQTMFPPYDSTIGNRILGTTSIWMACDSKTFKDEVAGMEDPSLPEIMPPVGRAIKTL